MLFLRNRILTRLTIAAALIALTRVTCDSIRLRRALHSSSPPGAGITTRSEITDVFLHPSLADLARRHMLDAQRLRSPEAVCDCLRAQGLEQVWYVTLVRNYLRDGSYVEHPHIHYPCMGQDQRVNEICAILALAAGTNPARIGIDRPDLAGARIQAIPEGALKLAPHDAIPDLLLLRQPRNVRALVRK